MKKFHNSTQNTNERMSFRKKKSIETSTIMFKKKRKIEKYQLCCWKYIRR
jgi:hypothetical protein